MNNNSLKGKFNDFQPSPEPGDWEQMEILLERSKFKYGFLISIMMAVVASGGLLFLYGHMYVPDDLGTEISNYASTNIDGGNTNILKNEKEVDAVETGIENFHENNVGSKKMVSIDSNFSTSDDSKSSIGEDLNIENKSSDQIANHGLATKMQNAEDFVSESEEDLLTIRIPKVVHVVEAMFELPVNKYEVVDENKAIEMSPVDNMKRNKLRYMSISVVAYSPIVYFKPFSTSNLLTNLGVNFHRDNAFLGANVGVSNLALAPNNLDRFNLVNNNSSYRNLNHLHTLTLHLDVRAGYSFRLGHKINISPYLGLGVLAQKQRSSNDQNESAYDPGFANSEDFNLAYANYNLLFIQTGASLSYLINARWSVHADCSYQQSLSRVKMGILSPGIGLSYRFQL